MIQHSPALKREFTVWSSFAYGFAFISPRACPAGMFVAACDRPVPSAGLTGSAAR